MMPKEAIQIFGEDTWHKMEKYLTCAAIVALPGHHQDIPDDEIDRAYRYATNKPVCEYVFD